MRRDAVRRPGFGSAVVRVIAGGVALLWLPGITELLDVWGEPDGYTVPAEIALPRATIWVGAAVAVATAALLGMGWWQRRHRGSPRGVRVCAMGVGALQAVWAVLLFWSAVLTQRDLNAPDSAAAVGAGQFAEFVLSAVSVMAAITLVRDALAPVPPPTPPVRVHRRPGIPGAVVRGVLAAVFVVLVAAVPPYIAGWSHQEAQYMPGFWNVPWGPVLVAVACGTSAVLLPLGWLWRRRGAGPASARLWLWTATGLQAAWAVALLFAFLEGSGERMRQFAFSTIELLVPLALFALAVATAAIHDRDARRLGPVGTAGSVGLAGGAGGEQAADGVEAGATVV